MSARAGRPALLLLILALAAGAVSACKENTGVKVKSFKFTGVKAVKESQIKGVLATAASSKIPWGEKRYFSREQFEADLKRIVAFYRDRGFPDARVTSFDAKLNADQTAVDVIVNIAEGEPLVVERIDLIGFDALPPRPRANLPARLPLKAGMPLDRALIQASRETALDELKEFGHPYASVRLSESQGSSPRHHVITLNAQPGALARYGDVQVSGNTSVGEEVIRRQLTFRPGERYRQSQLLESQRKLYALEVFQFANVEPIRVEGEEPAEIPTRVTVTEGKHRRMNLALGYGSEEKARVEATWRHVNFFGGARTAGVTGRYSKLDRGVRLELTQPYLFSPRYSITFSAQNWHNDEPAFVLDTIGGRVTVTRVFQRGRPRRAVGTAAPMTLAVTYRNEWERQQLPNSTLTDLSLRDDLIALGIDPRFGDKQGQTIGLGLDATRNMTDNALDARRGYVATVHLEKAGGFLQGDYNYYELNGEGRYFVNVADKAILALRLRAGTIDPAGGNVFDGVPFYKRYFLGGTSNLRGWGRYEVSPLSGFGLPIGGHSFMNFATEIRVPIWGNLGGVLFLDGGNAWTDPWDINVNELVYDVGPGLRYNTPIGPIRVDFGYQLNRIEGLLVDGKPESRRYRFHFSIGQAF